MISQVIVNGAQGKMGALACRTIQEHADFTLVASTGRHDNLQQIIKQTKADIVIDLTRADCVYENSLKIIEANAHPIIGTSGLKEEQIAQLSQMCEAKKLGGMIIPNFSISAILMMRFASIAARYLPEVEIVEMHHQQKFDSPSGTAIKTAAVINSARSLEQKNRPVNIHSLRLPGVLARQSVIFGNVGETLTITHDSIDRASFMPGLILACQKVTQLKTLIYGLEHILDFAEN